MNLWELQEQTVVGKRTALKDAQVPVPATCYPNGKGNFADVIRHKDPEMRPLSWIIWVGPTLSQGPNK